MSENRVPLKGRLGFAAGGGINAVGNFFHLSLLMIFLTDVVGIRATAVGIMMLVARIWDAVNDPAFGILIDRTHTPSGKTRPWIVWGGAAMCVFSALMFFTPAARDGGKLAWSYFSYIGFGMAYTACILAVFALTSRVTSQASERVAISAWYTGGNALIGTLLGVFGIRLITRLAGGSEARGYFLFAVMGGMLIFILALICTETNRELSLPETSEKRSLARTAKNIFNNKPLLIVITVAMLLVTGNCVSNGTLLYYVTYNLRDVELYSALAPMAYIGSALSCLTASWTVKRFGKRRSMIVLLGVCVCCYLVRFITRDATMGIILVMNAIFSFTSALYMVIYMPALLEAVDYGEYLTGERDDAVIMSTDTFQQKLGMGLASAITGFILDATGYVPNLEQQGQAALDGIFACTVTIPLALYAVALVLLMFYKISDRQMETVRRELERRRQTRSSK